MRSKVQHGLQPLGVDTRPDTSQPASRATVGRALTVARVSLDVVSICLAAGLAFVLRFGFGLFEVTSSSSPDLSAHIASATVWVFALGAFLTYNHLYDEDTLFYGSGELGRVFRACLEAVAALATFVFFSHSLTVSRAWFGLLAVGSFLLVSAQRALTRRWLDRQRRHGRYRRPAIVVAKEGAKGLGDFLRSSPEFELVGEVPPSELLTRLKEDTGGTSRTRVRQTAVVVKAGDFDADELWQIVLEAGNLGCPTFVHSSVKAVGRERVTVREIGGHAIVKVGPPRLTGVRRIEKRCFDVVGAALLLVVCSPVLLLAGAAVWLSSGRPVLYGQERIGKDGRPFRIWKFRTMHVGAEADTGPVWASDNDPRRTTVGGFLRRTSLDELPQLWNVLKGDMSLVGPRPERAPFVGRFSQEHQWYDYRHRIRPGITGWAQAHGLRGNTSIVSRTEFDNWYIEHWSLLLDVRILARSALEVFIGRNAG